MKKNQTPLADHEIDRVGASVRAYLNVAEDRVDDVVAARLASARHRAVSVRQAAAVAPAAVATGGSTAALGGGWGKDLRNRLSDWRFWAVGLVFSALLATYGTRLWSEYITAREALDVDIMILGDDVPVDALLDRGFSQFVQEGE
ncbi:MAG: DUF3619 family protein [Casimicrobiaceae bacterium]